MSTHLLLALALAAAPAASAASPASQPATEPAPIDTVRLQSELQRAEKATYSGRAREARTIYRKLLDEQRNAGEYARQTLWNLAMHYLYQEDPGNAAVTLDELAKQANQFGDPTTELRATFEAAVLWTKARRPAYASERAQRIRDLMKSPVIAESDKAEYRRRMV